ncbi:hypothetical protein [Andreprevotia sp. IGB-42]|uniref:WapI family immunity protein n=1 Tax=Andreprevotia sp. IGB-42 TaxID=2497473 RepID=UPI00135B7B4C|nr:hypothetical protein [Andreprevotia sp. IGB-42]
MQIKSDDNLVELSLLERIPKGLPNEGNVHISVRATLGEFSAFHKSVWIEEEPLNRFISELSILASTRSGSAILESYSPEDFRLEFRNRDTLGHIVIEIQLCQYQYSGPTYWPIKLSGGFEADPSSIKCILDGFINLQKNS